MRNVATRSGNASEHEQANRSACHTQETIAEAVGLTQQAVQKYLQKIQEEFRGNDSGIFRNFEPQLYSIWNFPKATRLPPARVDGT